MIEYILGISNIAADAISRAERAGLQKTYVVYAIWLLPGTVGEATAEDIRVKQREYTLLEKYF